MYNGILLRNKAFDENNYLPAFFYVVAILSVPDFMSLSPQLMSLTFILAAFGKVLRRIDNQATDELFLNSGIYVGVATMIYLPSAVFFVVFLVALIVFSSAIARRILLYLFGFFLTIGLCCLYFIWRGDLDYFIQSFFTEGLFMPADVLLTGWQTIIVSGAFVVVFIITILKAISASRLTNFQQRVQQVIWFMFLGGIACFFLANKKSGIELIFLVPLMAYFMSHYFMLIKKRLVKAIMPGIVVFGLLGYNLYVYQNFIDPLLVKGIEIKNEKILILDENFGYYLENESGSPCFSKTLCEEAFAGLNYYQTATHIHEWFSKTDPDLIIDKLDVIPQLFHRFPQLKKKYRKIDQHSYARISN